ncbi:hypothetical protein SELMODRAFT_431560 [Selaginella moellendorffii]|uniref:Uncharacterized protein n=1 Tax=Selaginella moellendorffii TaxID=88036 RepID=D8TD21_SELML|nr:hypothetical protein SELMODRAFT_431560 [Selaginella moellendorffii]
MAFPEYVSPPLIALVARHAPADLDLFQSFLENNRISSIVKEKGQQTITKINDEQILESFEAQQLGKGAEGKAPVGGNRRRSLHCYLPYSCTEPTGKKHSLPAESLRHKVPLHKYQRTKAEAPNCCLRTAGLVPISATATPDVNSLKKSSSSSHCVQNQSRKKSCTTVHAHDDGVGLSKTKRKRATIPEKISCKDRVKHFDQIRRSKLGSQSKPKTNLQKPPWDSEFARHSREGVGPWFGSLTNLQEMGLPDLELENTLKSEQVTILRSCGSNTVELIRSNKLVGFDSGSKSKPKEPVIRKASWKTGVQVHKSLSALGLLPSSKRQKAEGKRVKHKLSKTSFLPLRRSGSTRQQKSPKQPSVRTAWQIHMQ